MDEKASRLKHARLAAGFERPVDAAERFGWSVNTYKSNENGNASFSFKKAKEYAKAFKVRAEWLYDGIAGDEPAPPKVSAKLESSPGDPVNLADLRALIALRASEPKPPQVAVRSVRRSIPIMGEVAAGLWREAPARQLQDAEDSIGLDVTGYERAVLSALKVVGPSMDLVYSPGRYVIIAHPAEAGLRNGDYVVVQRARSGLVEITLKEFVQEPDGRVALWPRSSHPDFQEPLYFRPTDEADQDGLQIIGVVVADYARRDRPPIVYAPQGSTP